MARLGEVPFARYYGSVDATPLFVMPMGAYYARTGDLDTVRRLWPNVMAELRWIDTSGDPDRDGFVEYHRQRETGLINQGWKDSVVAIFHAYDELANGPIALCEVQGYVFAGKRHAATLALALATTAARLEAEAEILRQKFVAVFWCEELPTYALALDGEKRPCQVIASNAGHALLTVIAAPDRAERVAATLMGVGCFSGCRPASASNSIIAPARSGSTARDSGSFIEHLHIRGLRLGDADADVLFHRFAGEVAAP